MIWQFLHNLAEAFEVLNLLDLDCVAHARSKSPLVTGAVHVKGRFEDSGAGLSEQTEGTVEAGPMRFVQRAHLCDGQSEGQIAANQDKCIVAEGGGRVCAFANGLEGDASVGGSVRGHGSDRRVHHFIY